MVEAMIFILKTGVPWRDLPTEFGPWESVYTRFSRWTKSGVWQKVLDELAKDHDPSTVMIDSTTIRAHQDAAGVKGGDQRRLELLVVALERRSTPSSTRRARPSRSR
jgi:transposase